MEKNKVANGRGGGTVTRRACRVEPDVLERVGPFNALDRRQVIRLTDQSTCRVYHRAEEIAHPQSENDTVFAIGGGLARLYSSAPDGRGLTLALLKENMVCGAMFLGPMSEDCTLEALVEGTVVYRVPRKPLSSITTGNSAFKNELERVSKDRLAQAYDRMTALTLLPAPVRVRDIVLELSELDDRGIVPLTYSQLASVVGAAPETVARILGQLHEAGLVQYQPHHRDQQIRVVAN